MLRTFFSNNNKHFDAQFNILYDYIERELKDHKIKSMYCEIGALKNYTDERDVFYTFHKLNDESYSPNYNSAALKSLENNQYIRYLIAQDTKGTALLLEIVSCYDNSFFQIGSLEVVFQNHKDLTNLLNNLIVQPSFNQWVATLFTGIYYKVNLTDRFIRAADTYTELLKVKERSMPYHSLNVADFSLLIFQDLFPSADQIARLNIYFAGLLHDVGKIFLPESIIAKGDSITESESNYLKRHAIAGYELVKNEVLGIEVFKSLPKYIKHHHEWFDGSGYPDGLQGEDIPLFSRIIQVAESIDVMLSDRGEKERNTLAEVIDELQANSGIQFDPKIVNTAVKIMVQKRDLSDILNHSDSAFIPNASLSFQSANLKEIIVMTGNLLYQKDSSRFISHSNIDVETLRFVTNATLCFYSHNILVQYDVKVSGFLGRDILLDNILFKPMDHYFSIMWEVPGIISFGHVENLEVDIIRVGGNSISFSLLNEITDANFLNSTLMLKFSLCVEEFCESFVFNSIVVDIHNIKSKKLINVEFQKVLTNDRDRLFRMLFKKQIYNNKLKQLRSNS